LRASLEEEGRGEGERGKEKEKAAIQRVLSNPMNSQCLLIISIIVRPSHRQEHVKTTTTTTTEVITPRTTKATNSIHWAGWYIATQQCVKKKQQYSYIKVSVVSSKGTRNVRYNLFSKETEG